MPFVRIDLLQGKSAQHRKAIGEIVYQAMRDIIDVPVNDKFQIITEHPSGGLNIAENYMGNTYSADIVMIQITLTAGRTTAQKQAFYKRIVDDMAAQLGHRRDDVMINLVEVTKECWSFGNGVAQYVK